MLDFFIISTRRVSKNEDGTRKTVIEIYPKFIIKKSNDVMIRGQDFYAVWLEDQGVWSTEEDDLLQLIDDELDKYAAEHEFSSPTRIMHIRDSETRIIDKWHNYCKKDMRDWYKPLDDKIIFSNNKIKKTDYASRRLPYPLEEGSIENYETLMNTLYSPEEREKIEWAIGSIINGDSKKIQKFLVLYGSAGTGKSTVLNIIQKLFDGYYSVFDAKALGSSSNVFALEAFKSNPLVAIQHDGDLSKIEDNTRLNSLVSHEIMTVNEKFKSTYSTRFKSFLFMGTNKPVKITDAKSGLIRRLIDVTPTGNKLTPSEYKNIMSQIDFELGAIAYHCKEVYESDPGKYDSYIPISMMASTNDFYNFMLDSYYTFKDADSTTLKDAWRIYNAYVEEARLQYPFTQRVFKEELKNYFKEYLDRAENDGTRARSVYKGFIFDKFSNDIMEISKSDKLKTWIDFKEQDSVFDILAADYQAQYAKSDGSPKCIWDNVEAKLKDINTHKLHYVRVPENHIVIDFDIPDENGEKSFEKNLEAASKWPPTYAELSKSGKGIHLHYIYDGDVSQLSNIYADHVEIKVFSGKSSLRRLLTKCTSNQIAKINSGLPLREKENKKVVNFETIANEKALRTLIRKHLKKEIFPNTKPSVDMIASILDRAVAQNLQYDISDLQQSIYVFCASSSNQADYCLKQYKKMIFRNIVSDAPDFDIEFNPDEDLVFFDCEVFPNLFLINWKVHGKPKVVRMINPTPQEVSALFDFKLVGFNCRKYDNHILYARANGYSNEELYNLSQSIINGDKNAFFINAYNISYTDVYDFCSKKQSLKKWEIELGIHHKELGYRWDQPVPKEKWVEVAEYCDNDVIATEAVFDARQADFTARKILADIAGMTVNTPTNNLTTRIIFGDNKKPQSVFNYRNMGDVSQIDESKTFDEITKFDKQGRPIFEGYEFKYDGTAKKFVSSYLDDPDVGEGGKVYALPGMYWDIALLDIASMHPSSTIAEQLFGPEYTKRFEDIKEARVAIKHKDFERARKMLDGKLAKYLVDESIADDLAQALKIVINSVYGLTAAKFANAFMDIRNKDNIVAKRGALFMVNLKHEVEKRGYIVAHIKTDSIKIPNATPEIIKFVQDYGKMYGYNFEHEATYDRMCLVNDAVYIAKYATVERCCELYGESYVNSAKDICKDNKKHPGEWTATGTQFQIPYVFKKLFSKEEIQFDDLCETKAVTSALYLDMIDESTEEKICNKEAMLDRLNNRLKNHPDDEELISKISELESELTGLHNYEFVGKVGQFCPVRKDVGGVLVRENVNKNTNEVKYDSAGGAKGYRWLESETVKALGLEDAVDETYYRELVNNAINDISQYGDFYGFVA